MEPPEAQARLVADAEKAGYDNDTACLVNSRWLAHWRLWSSRDACGAPAPGAVDNACLLAGDGTLQGGLTWRVHYDAVPEAAWRLLARWHGGGPRLACAVVAGGRIALETCRAGGGAPARPGCPAAPPPTSTACAACAAPLAVAAVAAAAARRDCGDRCQRSHWSSHRRDCGRFAELNAAAPNAPAAPRRSPRRRRPPPPPPPPGPARRDLRRRRGGPPPPRPDAAAEAAAAAKLRGSAATASSTGLANLGNTCYFNASLQCLSRAAPLSRHFLSDGFAADVNEANPMGCGGRVAREYAAALKVAFHRGDRVHSPHALLRSIVRHNADFEGRRQHDAHELLTTLLDGLHEDLNRVRGKKPYFETPESTGPRDDARVAAATWAQHRRRNDSVVVDALHGLLRSTLECPVCGSVSTHFDPFSTLELELADAPGHRSVDEDDDVDDELCADDSDDGVDVADGFVSLAEDGRGAVGAPGAAARDRRTARSSGAAAPLGCPADRVEVVAVHALGERDVDSDDDLRFCCERPFAAGPPKRGSRFSRPVAVRDGDAVVRRESRRGAARGDTRRAAPRRTTATARPAACSAARTSPSSPSTGADAGAPPRCGDAPKTRSRDDVARAVAYARAARGFGRAPRGPGPAAAARRRAARAGRRRALAARAALETAGGAFAFAGGRWPGLGAAGRPLSLEGCLRRFTAPETLDADNPWRCGSCAAPRRAVKRIALWRAPEILVCCLKRFGGRGKLDGDVDFPLDGLDLAPYVAHGGPGLVTNHFGASFGGHYTAFARDDDGGWLKCDDSAVSPVPAAVVKSRAAYVLFYKRRATS
ncbi:ubiquitinyl hydrolase [Aureococcus anophagefferens]|nr:ubiquitinyl hydrolase [Aureococcus anophagefferens]